MVILPAIKNNNPTLVLLFYCFLFFSIDIYAQRIQRETISPYVSSTSSIGVTVRQTVGQPYQTQTNNSDKISYRPGFQQPVFSTEIISATIHVTLLPNPALFSFFIESSEKLEQATLSAFDAAGKLIYSEKFEEFKKQEVTCATWANGAYIINLTDRKGNLISAKIIKHQ